MRRLAGRVKSWRRRPRLPRDSGHRCRSRPRPSLHPAGWAAAAPHCWRGDAALCAAGSPPQTALGLGQARTIGRSSGCHPGLESRSGPARMPEPKRLPEPDSDEGPAAAQDSDCRQASGRSPRPAAWPLPGSESARTAQSSSAGARSPALSRSLPERPGPFAGSTLPVSAPPSPFRRAPERILEAASDGALPAEPDCGQRIEAQWNFLGQDRFNGTRSRGLRRSRALVAGICLRRTLARRRRIRAGQTRSGWPHPGLTGCRPLRPAKGLARRSVSVRAPPPESAASSCLEQALERNSGRGSAARRLVSPNRRLRRTSFQQGSLGRSRRGHRRLRHAPGGDQRSEGILAPRRALEPLWPRNEALRRELAGSQPLIRALDRGQALSILLVRDQRLEPGLALSQRLSRVPSGRRGCLFRQVDPERTSVRHLRLWQAPARDQRLSEGLARCCSLSRVLSPRRGLNRALDRLDRLDSPRV